MIQLRFALREVLAVAEHATAAGHRPSFADTVDGTTPTPALWLVGDDGLYRL